MYGIDVGDRGLMRSRSWPWLQSRIGGLMGDQNTRLHRLLTS